jgi:hypothetical protein
MLLLSFFKIVIPMSKLERLLVDMAVLFFPFSFLVVVLMEIDARGIAGEIDYQIDINCKVCLYSMDLCCISGIPFTSCPLQHTHLF